MPRASELGLGRTRIGVETGDVIVGDVGLRTKLDYTAYGDAVNSAARLEAANKELGSTICIGPEAASRSPPDLLRPIATIQLRGFTEAVCTNEPPPSDTHTVAATSHAS
jgi:adenylate cyclase